MWPYFFKHFLKALSLSSLCFSHSAFSLPAEKPLWEIGAGLFAFTAPHYLGSQQNYQLLLPTPAFIYRGNFFKSDRRGIRSEFITHNNWKLSVSFSGALPVNSEDNDAREGMNDLDTLIEFGPLIQYHFTNEQDTWQFYLDLPLRIALSFDGFNSSHRGFSTNPVLVSEFNTDLKSGSLSWRLALGPQYASNSYHDYFYGVDVSDATNSRPAYNAESGYLGFRLSSRVSYRTGNWRSSVFLRHYNLQHAANDDSPLLLDEQYWSLGLNVVYFFSRSSRAATQ